MPTISIETTRFGALEIASEDVLEFPTGLVGLPSRRYTIHTHDAGSPFRWLQSVDDGSLALPITSPWSFFADFEFELADEDAARVGAADEPEVWVVVRASSELAEFSANLHAPIVIAGGRGHQLLNMVPYPVRVPLFDAVAQAA
jgi:flagellar assembly factor FliW